jgi:hypothetical protein
MKFLELIDTKLSLKSSFKVLSGLLMLLSPIQDVCSHAVLLGPPQRISPIPGPANPDPILQNLQSVMDEFFQPPYYPGGSPDYLSQIYYMSNSYIGLADCLAINPIDDRIMHVSMGQNYIVDLTHTYVDMIGSNTFATSFDQGLSWSYGPPIEQTIALGGTISQLINSSLGPGLYYKYAKNGRLYAYGQGFDDLHPNPPNQVPLSGFLFTSSEDNGKTWAAPNIVLTTEADWWFTGAPYGVGLGWWDWFCTPDPVNSDLIHGSASSVILPNQLWGSLFYNRSEDGGKTFTPIRQIYNMVDDPVWQAEHFNPEFTSDPNYFVYGGWSLHSSAPVIYDENILLQPTIRFYPKVGATTYTFSNFDTAADQAVVRSFDNGKTWSPIAGATDQYNADPIPHDPGFVNFTIFIEGSGQTASTVVSPFTGRVYLAYAAGNPASNPNPDIASFYPFVLLSASSDKAATWTRDRQQAFAHTMIMTLDGHLVVAYYDLRNWLGFPGEDVNTTPLSCDFWLAIYKETDNPRGGSTGVGLDFVEEIRLTPQSFNLRFGTLSPAKIGTSDFEGSRLEVNSKNELFAFFTTTNKPSPSKITTGYRGMTIDTNSRWNVLLQRIKFPNPGNR